jgi:NadR type nicotinamide-nucleotide adenylyltransferase
MKKRFRRGLVVGKFCPLHLGHEFCIRRMIEECEEAIVISYTNPEFPGCEPTRRRGWLHERFPHQRLRVLVLGDQPGELIPPNDAEEVEHRRFVGALCRDRLGVTVDAVFTSERYGDGFARELTTYFREGEPSHPEVVHRCVDLGRELLPVSGSMLRADVHANRRWLGPEVYADFVQRICLLGGESSGKSTLTVALAEAFGTAMVAEYGRECWEARGGVLRPDDLLHIAAIQIERENAAVRSALRYVFCDTSPLTTLCYSECWFQRADPWLQQAAQRRYALNVLCAPDFPFVQDGTRADEAFRQRQHEWYHRRLPVLDSPWMPAGGDVGNRVEMVRRWLSSTQT